MTMENKSTSLPFSSRSSLGSATLRLQSIASHQSRSSSKNSATPGELRTQLPLRTACSPFEYEALQGDEIRVLVVEPGERDQKIFCKLIHVRLRDDISFEAVSYAWGDPTPGKSIILKTSQGRCHFGVTKNLRKALYQFRDSVKSVTLWIDALCVNQKDVEEKSAQVMRMTEIYSRADRVRVWLGVADKWSDDALSYLEETLQKDKIEVTEHDDDGIDSLDMLLRRPWFRRRWVIQEIAFAKNITLFCGAKCLPWKDFADSFVTFLRLLPTESDVSYIGEDFSRTCANTLIYVSNNIFQRDSKAQRIIHWLVSIEALLQRLNQFEATDPRDVVYALLALGKDTYASKSIPVDYMKPVWEVYRDVIALIVSQSKSLDIICRPWAPLGSGMPSWIQSCSKASFQTNEMGVTTITNADTLVGETGRSAYRACGNSLSMTASSDFSLLGEASKVIIADGFIVDEIETCGDVAVDGVIPRSWLKLGGWNSEAAGLPPDIFWRTLVANRDDKGDHPPAWYPRICHRVFADADSGHAFTAFSPGLLKDRYKDAPMVREFINRLYATTWNRSFGKTAINEAPGLFPASTKKGDLICILYGCSVPVVMRRMQTTNTQGMRKPAESPTGVHIEPYLTQLRSIYLKQGASWDDGVDADIIFHAEGSAEQELLESYQKRPVKRGNVDVRRASNAAKDRDMERSSQTDLECTLVGECFMYGVMDGEAMELIRSGGLGPIKFGIW